jgi:uncharacterized protein YecE (DUF72 family)
MALKNVFIGTAGFSYRDWLGNFYPQFCPPADFLRCYAATFSTVELDSTFYRIPSRQTLDKWDRMTPDGFRFAAKFPRTVTHEGELHARVKEADRFIDVMVSLGAKLGPLLMQFPPSFRPDRRGVLEALLGRVPAQVRLAVELRDPTWLNDGILDLLKRRGAALCLIEYPGMPRLAAQTSDLVYLRFLGDRYAITEDFSYVRHGRDEELDHWSELARRFAGENVDVYAYFNNHFSGHAPSTAVEFRERLERKPSRKA